MRNRRKLVAIIAGIMAGIMVLSLILSLIPAASAASSSEIRQQIRAMENQQEQLRQQMAELQEQYQENEDEIANLVARKNKTDQEIFLLHSQIELINEQIAAYSLLIADKQDELDTANVRLDELNEKYRDRIRTMEEEGSLSYWAVLFQANSFSDLLDRLNMIEEIAAADRRHLEELNDAANAVEEAQEALEVEKADLETTKDELDTTYQELEQKQEEAKELLNELIERADELQALYEESERAEAALMEEIAQKEAEYSDAKYREWLAHMATATTAPPETTRPTQPSQGVATEPEDSSGSSETTAPPEETTPPETTEPKEDSGSTSVSWRVPCSYVKLTSPFGYRDAPTAGASTYHQGVDLAGPEGTPIYATRAGYVTIARYSSSAGYYVSINHGDGYSSIYMHMTTYVVSAGQTVAQGQLIGYMGSTGISTGSHLHFGISYNGTYVNPAYYVPLY